MAELGSSSNEARARSGLFALVDADGARKSVSSPGLGFAALLRSVRNARAREPISGSR
jgi:hypothetical protein